MFQILLQYFVDAMVAVRDLRRTLPVNPAVPWKDREQTAVKMIVVHHAAGALSATSEGIANYHIGKGWPGMAYTFYVKPDGVVDFCHRITQIGTHAGKVNPYSLGICLAGNWSKMEPTALMVNRLYLTIGVLQAYYHAHFGYTLEVVPHRALTATVCPGLAWESYLLACGRGAMPR